MKTFREFITEAPTAAQAAQMAPGMSPEKRRRALERNARNQARRSTPETPQDRMRRAPQKALPPGPGALAKRNVAMTRAAKKPSSIVRTQGSGPSKEAVGKSTADKAARSRPSGGYMGKPDGPKGKSKDGDWGKKVSDQWPKGKEGNKDKKKDAPCDSGKRRNSAGECVDTAMTKLGNRFNQASNIAKKVGSAFGSSGSAGFNSGTVSSGASTTIERG